MEAKTIKASIQDLDKIVKNSSISDHKHNGLGEALEEILKPPCLENSIGRERSVNPSLLEARLSTN